jgi:hypothetical protein
MSADRAGGVGPVSVRYAAQIRELLYAHAVQRMVADQEAARAQAESDRQSRLEAASKREAEEPVKAKVDVEPSKPAAEPVKAETKEPAHLVDIQV